MADFDQLNFLSVLIAGNRQDIITMKITQTHLRLFRYVHHVMVTDTPPTPNEQSFMRVAYGEPDRLSMTEYPNNYPAYPS